MDLATEDNKKPPDALGGGRFVLEIFRNVLFRTSSDDSSLKAPCSPSRLPDPIRTTPNDRVLVPERGERVKGKIEFLLGMTTIQSTPERGTVCKKNISHHATSIKDNR